MSDDDSTEVSKRTNFHSKSGHVDASSLRTPTETQANRLPTAFIVEIPEAASSQSTSSHDVDIKLEQFPEHLLGVDTIQKGAPLARGGMANVFNGKYGVIPVALKEALHSLDTLLNEAAIIMKLKHPNVVQVYGIWKDRKERVFMVVSAVIVYWCNYH